MKARLEGMQQGQGRAEPRAELAATEASGGTTIVPVSTSALPDATYDALLSGYRFRVEQAITEILASRTALLG